MATDATIPKLWPGEAVAIVASGPSLVAEDVDRLRGRVRVIAVNDAVQLAPWADVLYSSDLDWWQRAKGAPTFGGRKFAIEQRRGQGAGPFKAWPEIVVLRNTGAGGFDDDPSGLRNYRNSGGAAIALAVHLGCTKIVLLGFDMALGRNGRRHFCDDGSSGASPYHQFIRAIATMAPILSARGVSVVNCSRLTKLDCFPRVSLDGALRVEVAA